MNYIRGLAQEVQYGSSAARLWYTPTVDGREAKPDAAPKIAIYNTAGSVQISATDMTAATAVTDGYLAYDAQTADFLEGEIVTGGTSGATATVRGQSKTGATGILRLAGVDGTFQDNDVLSGSYSGAAVANKTLYSLDYYYDLDASSYDIGEDYHAQITFDVSSFSHQDWMYFDVVYYPFKQIITSSDIELAHPDWSRFLPSGWDDWQGACMAGHRELAMRIRALGRRGAFIVKREELYGIELAFVEYEVARRATGMTREQIDFYASNRANAWSGRGEFTYHEAGDDSVAPVEKVVMSHRLVR